MGEKKNGVNKGYGGKRRGSYVFSRDSKKGLMFHLTFLISMRGERIVAVFLVAHKSGCMMFVLVFVVLYSICVGTTCSPT